MGIVDTGTGGSDNVKVLGLSYSCKNVNIVLSNMIVDVRSLVAEKIFGNSLSILDIDLFYMPLRYYQEIILPCLLLWIRPCPE